MERGKPVTGMQINAVEVINAIDSKFSLSLLREIVRMGYDSEADVLYLHFVANAGAKDSKILDENENVILGVDENEDQSY